MAMSSSFLITPARQCSTRAAHGAVLEAGLLSMPRTSLKNAGTAGSRPLRASTLLGTPLPQVHSAEEGCLFADHRRRAGGAPTVVRATSIGVVKKVQPASKEGGYFSVTLEVKPGAEVVKWYQTPGQYANLIRVDSQHDSPRSFFIVTPPLHATVFEFLIEDVPNTVANELVNSKPGDRVVITTDPWSHGFTMSGIEAAESVLMFAGGYGLGPFRALIEKGFQANKKKNAILYTLFGANSKLEPFLDRHAAWEATGVEVQRGLTQIQETVPTKTVVLMVASTVQQQKLASYFEDKGVPVENIQTLFDGIPVSEHAYYNKVTHKLINYPKFLHSGPKNVPLELKI